MSKVMRDLSYLVVIQQSLILGLTHKSSGGQELHHVHELGQYQLITTGYSCMEVRGRRTKEFP